MSFVLALALFVLLTGAALAPAEEQYRTDNLSGVVTETIFGVDDRQHVKKLTWPFNAVARLLSRSGKLVCTGTFILPTSVLTAAHCGTPAWVENVFGERFRVKARLVSPEFASSPGSALHSYSQITPDVAVLIIDATLSSKHGFVGTDPGQVPDGSCVTLVGFHGDEPSRLQKQQCKIATYVTYFSSDRIEHRCSTTSGASGSPLLYYRSGSWYVVGVHVGPSRSDKVNLASVLGDHGHDKVTEFVRAATARGHDPARH